MSQVLGKNNRPRLTKSLDADTFRDYYWLKAELQAFCREHGLGTGGIKTELARRIELYLQTGRPSAIKTHRRNIEQMPEQFNLDTVIGTGWRCTTALRSFFMEHLGPSFRFNSIMRQFIHERAGHTLAEAIAAYREEKSNTQHAEIGEQFEYNRFTRAHWHDHPDATRDEVIAAWYEFRNTAKSKRQHR